MMIRIDGARGEGGGQVLRSALTLSMATGQAFQIENIRAGRARPGLMRQHLTAALAAREICDGKLSGGELGSTALSFRPGVVRGGDYKFSIGSAGGTGLVFQTLFPALLMADTSSRLTLEGGTHNAHAPPFEFLRDSFLSTLRGIDIDADITLQRAGFYPAGGGRFCAEIQPANLTTPLDLTERGDLIGIDGEARVANLPVSIAEREAKTLRERLNLAEDAISVCEVDSSGPGNFVMARLKFDRVTEVYTGFGEHGVKAERVAMRVAGRVCKHLNGAAATGPWLADQLLLPLALGAGGRFTTMQPTEHFKTNIDTIQTFLDVPIRHTEVNEGLWLVEIG